MEQLLFRFTMAMGPALETKQGAICPARPVLPPAVPHRTFPAVDSPQLDLPQPLHSPLATCKGCDLAAHVGSTLQRSPIRLHVFAPSRPSVGSFTVAWLYRPVSLPQEPSFAQACMHAAAPEATQSQEHCFGPYVRPRCPHLTTVDNIVHSVGSVGCRQYQFLSVLRRDESNGDGR